MFTNTTFHFHLDLIHKSENIFTKYTKKYTLRLFFQNLLQKDSYKVNKIKMYLLEH